MTQDEILELGLLMGLKYNPKYNFPSETDVLFDGINGQRFRFTIDMTDKEIYEKMGNAMRLFGRRQLKLELNTLLNITSDN